MQKKNKKENLKQIWVNHLNIITCKAKEESPCISLTAQCIYVKHSGLFLDLRAKSFEDFYIFELFSDSLTGMLPVFVIHILQLQ